MRLYRQPAVDEVQFSGSRWIGFSREQKILLY